MFLKKIGSRTHSDPKFDQRGGGVSYIDAREKVPGRHSGFRPSEKELPESRSGAFRQNTRNTPEYIISREKGGFKYTEQYILFTL
jgi:hypothetical protein